jgi:Fanconi anemia group M protein
MQRPPRRFLTHALIYSDSVEEREYQRTIAKEAEGRNTLVVLPTALGKTVISALVAAEFLYNYRSGRVLVMAPTRPLISQHSSSFQRLIRLPEREFELLTGMMPSDYRSDVWARKTRMVFATPQVVRNDIREGRLDLREFGLIVFDECHRAVKDYAYTEVATTYLKANQYPRILALTASPGSDPGRIRDVCRLLAIEHVETRSETDSDVSAYINPVSVE